MNVRSGAEERHRVPGADLVETSFAERRAHLARRPAYLLHALTTPDPVAALAQEPLHVGPALVAGAIVAAVHYHGKIAGVMEPGAGPYLLEGAPVVHIEIEM